jgi:hypothetical protein
MSVGYPTELERDHMLHEKDNERPIPDGMVECRCGRRVEEFALCETCSQQYVCKCCMSTVPDLFYSAWEITICPGCKEKYDLYREGLELARAAKRAADAA